MKIISGGQTGVDQAGLDAAIDLNMDYGGSIPKGRLTENGPLDAKYDRMTELESADYSERTEQNVKDACATLIFTVGEASGGTALTIEFANQHNKPYLLVDLKEKNDVKITKEVKAWLKDINPNILNIAGPRESKAKGIYDRTFYILKKIFNSRYSH
jgi:hypothetical protein